MDIVLQLEGITKRFGNVIANDSIDLSVKQGSIHAVIGENGAGKSTLMNIIAGIHQMDKGNIILRGKRMNFRSADDASRQGIGMVHQEFMLFPGFSVLENLMIGFERTKNGIFLDKKRAQQEIELICQQYHFNIPLHAPAENQPVALLQQIEIVKVLYHGAEILIFDEPTSVLTPQGIEGLFKAMRHFVSVGKTILFITHKLKEVLAIAEEITVLKDGRVAGNLQAADTDEEELASMIVGRKVFLNFKKAKKIFGDVVLDVNGLCLHDSSGRTRLNDVNLQVKAGEILGVAGVAGSGQLELAQAIFGLTKPSGGSISFKGEDISKLNCRERRCMGMGIVPQDRMRDGVNRQGRIWESAIMGYHIAHGFSNRYLLERNQISSFSNSIINTFAVKVSSIESKVSELSGGNTQKLIVGREFLQDNELLLIIDPTRGIDIGTIEFIWEMIGEIAARGVAILLISHELNEVMQLSDRILVMYDGMLYEGGQHGEMSEDEIGLLMTGGKYAEG